MTYKIGFSKKPSAAKGIGRILVAGILLVALAGCITQARERKAEASANQMLGGTPAAEFFKMHGMPSRTTGLTDGHTLYEWRSDLKPSTSPLFPPVCVLQIQADGTDTIVAVSITHDTPGTWKPSRCFELFH